MERTFDRSRRHDYDVQNICFYPDAWAVTERCKRAIDALNRTYG
jgi:hypothetical protein